mgnify:CR=1 FL=1
MKRYSVVQIGLGARGITHLKGFQNHQARIEIAGICDLQPERVELSGTNFKSRKNVGTAARLKCWRSCSLIYSLSVPCPTQDWSWFS